MMSSQADTGFVYEHDRLEIELFSGKFSPQERVKKIESYLFRHPNRQYFGLNKLTLEKKDVVRKIDFDLKTALGNIEDFRKLVSKATDGAVDVLEIEGEVQALRERVLTNAAKNVKRVSKRGQGFLQITKDGELKINVTKFEFIRYYSVLYYHLLLPHFDILNDGRDVEKSGLMGFIAKKLNFEFEGRLGFRLSSDFVSKKIKDAKSINHLDGLPLKMKLVDKEFYQYLFSSLPPTRHEKR